MAPTPQQTATGYRHLWNEAQVRPERVSSASRQADRIIAGKDVYEGVSKLTGGVPWWFIGAIHVRESDQDFHTHLHCGDPLTARTFHEPRGRPVGPPKSGHLPYTFEESAMDALMMAPHKLHEVQNWTLERTLYEGEKYNGWGYLKRGNSPYIWSWTTEYDHGKFIADGKYSEAAVDKQPGMAAMFKALAARVPEIAVAFEAGVAHTVPTDVTARYTERERKVAAGGAGAATVGAGSEVTTQTTQQPSKPAPALLPSVANYTLIGVGVAIVLVALFMTMRKQFVLKEKWGL